MEHSTANLLQHWKSNLIARRPVSEKRFLLTFFPYWASFYYQERVLQYLQHLFYIFNLAQFVNYNLYFAAVVHSYLNLSVEYTLVALNCHLVYIYIKFVRDYLCHIMQHTLAVDATIEIRGIDRKRMLHDVSEVISDKLDVNIHRVTIESNEGIFDGQIEIRVHDRSEVKVIMDELRKIEDIKEVLQIL